jgi:hypothetical protein
MISTLVIGEHSFRGESAEHSFIPSRARARAFLSLLKNELDRMSKNVKSVQRGWAMIFTNGWLSLSSLARFFVSFSMLCFLLTYSRYTKVCSKTRQRSIFDREYPTSWSATCVRRHSCLCRQLEMICERVSIAVLRERRARSTSWEKKRWKAGSRRLYRRHWRDDNGIVFVILIERSDDFSYHPHINQAAFSVA